MNNGLWLWNLPMGTDGGWAAASVLQQLRGERGSSEFGYVKSENNHLYACSPKLKRRRFTFLFLFFFIFVKPCETRRFINSYSHRDLPFVQDPEYWRISIFRFGTVSIIRVCGHSRLEPTKESNVIYSIITILLSFWMEMMRPLLTPWFHVTVVLFTLLQILKIRKMTVMA